MDTANLTPEEMMRVMRNLPEPPEGYTLTGEFRAPKQRECYLSHVGGDPIEAGHHYLTPQIILRKIEPSKPKFPFQIRQIICDADGILRIAHTDGVHSIFGSIIDDCPNWADWQGATYENELSYFRRFPANAVRLLGDRANLMFKIKET